MAFKKPLSIEQRALGDALELAQTKSRLESLGEAIDGLRAHYEALSPQAMGLFHKACESQSLGLAPEALVCQVQAALTEMSLDKAVDMPPRHGAPRG